jgi:hypothetical protein
MLFRAHLFEEGALWMLPRSTGMYSLLGDELDMTAALFSVVRRFEGDTVC